MAYHYPFYDGDESEDYDGDECENCDGLGCEMCGGSGVIDDHDVVIRCRGTTLENRPCKITSEMPYDSADPLREGQHFCTHHAHQQDYREDYDSDGECDYCDGEGCSDCDDEEEQADCQLCSGVGCESYCVGADSGCTNCQFCCDKCDGEGCRMCCKNCNKAGCSECCCAEYGCPCAECCTVCNGHGCWNCCWKCDGLGCADCCIGPEECEGCSQCCECGGAVCPRCCRACGGSGCDACRDAVVVEKELSLDERLERNRLDAEAKGDLIDLTKDNVEDAAAAAAATSPRSARSHGRVCAACGKTGPIKKMCAGCKRVEYCSKECQKEHWRRAHKRECVGLIATAVVAIKGERVVAAAGKTMASTSRVIAAVPTRPRTRAAASDARSKQHKRAPRDDDSKKP